MTESKAKTLKRTEKYHTTDILKALEQAASIEEFTREYMDCFTDISIKDFLDHIFQNRGFKKADIIKASQLNEVYAYQILSGIRKPSRDKLLALALAMQLKLEECQQLLKLANVNELYAKNRRDAVIIFGLLKSLSVQELNELLYELEEITL